MNQCKSQLISLSLSQGWWRSLEKLKGLTSGHLLWWILFFRYKLLNKKQEMVSSSCSETSAIELTMQTRRSVSMPPWAPQSTTPISSSLSSSSSTPRSWGSWPSRSRSSILWQAWKQTWWPEPRRIQSRNLIRTPDASKRRVGWSSRCLWLSWRALAIMSPWAQGDPGRGSLLHQYCLMSLPVESQRGYREAAREDLLLRNSRGSYRNISKGCNPKINCL